MKKRGVRAIAFMTVAICGGISLHKTYSYIFSMRGCTIHVDSLLAESQQQEIANYLTEHPELYNQSLDTICAQLRTHYPYIQTIQAHRCASGQLELDMTAVTPVFLINEHKILAHNGTLYDHTIFEPAALAHLDHISIAQEFDAGTLYHTCSKQLTSAICSRYNVTWMNAREILLRDKENKQFSCICDATSLPDEQMLALLDQIKIDICSNQAHTRAKNWVADMRFSKQIVVHPEQGGYRG